MSNSPDSLRRAARRVEGDPFFLAGALQRYMDLTDLDEAGLAGFLGCDVHDLALLALCRRPAEDAGAFRGDVAHLAARFGLNEGRLAEIVRAVEAAEAFMAAGTAPSVGLAASDRADGEDGER